MRKLLIAAALCIPIAFAGCAHPYARYDGPPPPGAYSRIAEQGYRDGVHAARRDMRNGFRPDADRHPRFRRPPVPPPAWNDYRHGFRDGYQQVFRGPRG